MRQALGNVLKVIAAIAGVVFLFAPFTGIGILVCAVALVTAVVAGLTGSHLSDDEDSRGYWPKDPKSDSSL